MSGPCTDCGGPDYQTLVTRIAELEAMGTSESARLSKLLGETRAELAALKERYTHRWTQAVEGVETPFDVELVPKPELDATQAALAARDRMLMKEYESSTPRMAGYMHWYEDLRARAEEGSE